jgi:hypothetical protein
MEYSLQKWCHITCIANISNAVIQRWIKRVCVTIGWKGGHTSLLPLFFKVHDTFTLLILKLEIWPSDGLVFLTASIIYISKILWLFGTVIQFRIIDIRFLFWGVFAAQLFNWWIILMFASDFNYGTRYIFLFVNTSNHVAADPDAWTNLFMLASIIIETNFSAFSA